MDQEFIDSVAPRNNQTKHQKPKVIKRYGNRKLYDTQQSSYVVLNDIARMIRNEEEVLVIDNETRDDITSATLTQIIFGAEKKSSYSAPLNILKSIIRKGDGSFSNFLAEMGLFKAEEADKTNVRLSPKKNPDSSTPYSMGGKSFLNQHKSIPERVASAALEPDSSENEKTILPTSDNVLE